MKNLWPIVKTRIIYWFWIIQYGGKKNIPPEVVFGKLNETMESLLSNIQEAIKVSSTDMSEEERLVVRELMMKTANLKKEVRDLEHKSPGIKQRT